MAKEEGKTANTGLYESNQLDAADCNCLNRIRGKIIGEGRITVAAEQYKISEDKGMITSYIILLTSYIYNAASRSLRAAGGRSQGLKGSPHSLHHPAK